MKRKLVVAVCLVMSILLVFSAVGCVNYNQKAIETDFSNIDVTSNNGLAVRVGKYLYFVNGYADKSGENTFGNAVKGAIMRVELQDEEPVLNTLQTIVPKNVYNSNANIGIVVVGDYIYYTTPSLDKDSQGKAKTGEMDLMRTKLDGKKTQKIAGFSSYSVVYRVTPTGYILFVEDFILKEIDLSTNSFKVREVATEVGAYLFVPQKDEVSDFSHSVIYLQNDESALNYHNHVYLFRAGSEEPEELFDGLNSYEGKELEHAKGYKLSLTEIKIINKEKIRLFFKKTDSGTNTRSKGNYSYDFVNSDTSFDWKKEVRYTNSTLYDSFTLLNDTHILALQSSSYDLGKYDEGVWTFSPVVSASSIKILDIKEKDSEVTILYVLSDKIYSIKALDKVGGDYTISLEAAEILYSGGYFNTWLTYDKVYDTVYFFNSDLKNYTFYLNLSKIDASDPETKTPKRIGIFSHEDEIGMLKSDEKANT